MPLSYEEYYDKVYACWLGKNCGGTLGTPLERVYGEKEMFDVWWYPKLQEGGMPNDDLEIQLIWLKALEERGLDLKARDLAEYWLDCIQYNFDEYGLHKTNLRLGLIPPISGYYNNWFKDCMGCPIRSEIWACIAPGRPDIAVKYAYEDAIVDHAGGESVYGELFNAAVEAAAFVIDDRNKLLEIGLSYIPKDSLTAIAIRSAIEAHDKGLDWKEARNYVLDKCYSPIAQYSPVNLGFQTIGWLYGEDFGDAICKAVNCGWDTDCTGATLGSILGIMYGTKVIPEKWSAPLSDTITTNSSWGGIINLEEPKNLGELTERTCKIGVKVLALGGEAPDSMMAQSEVEYLWTKKPTQVEYDLHSFKAVLDYMCSPVIKPGRRKALRLLLENPRPVELTISGRFIVPEGWCATPAHISPIAIPPGGKAVVDISIDVDDVRFIRQTNRCYVELMIKDRPQTELVPVVLVGARRWLITTSDSPDNSFVADFDGYELPIEPLRNGSKSITASHYVMSPVDRKARVGVPSNCPMTLWLNGTMVHKMETPRIPRPNYTGDGASYVDVQLNKGWNHFTINLECSDDPIEAHFILATDGPYCHGLSDVTECKLPWEI